MAKKFRVLHDRPNCIACGACAAVSANWTLETEDGLADPVKDVIGEDELAENQEAAEVCPVFIISVNEIDD
jgi:ferredoxin